MMTPIEALKAYQSRFKFPIVCAVSGGVDSMVLLHALKAAGASIIVAHINHQLRDDAIEDERLVKTFSESLGCPVEIKRATLNGRGNTQNKGHQVRLAFYQAVAEKHGAKDIFIAHHKDDQIEHFFIQVLRGFSKMAWVGMPSERRLNHHTLVRPFLSLSKSDLWAYADQHQVSFRNDASNDRLIYLRNQIRHRLMPFIHAHAPELFTRISDGQKALQTRLAAEIATYLTASDDTYQLSYDTFLKVPSALRIRLLQHLWALASPYPPRSHAFWLMCERRMKESPANVHFHITQDWYLTLDYGMIRVMEVSKPIHDPVLISDFGTYRIHAGLTLEVTPQKKAHVGGLSLEVCYNERTFPMQVKTAQNGDIIAFDYGHKKVHQWFKDVKIPWGLRPQTLMVETSDQQVAILHSRFSQSLGNCASKVYIYEVIHAES